MKKQLQKMLLLGGIATIAFINAKAQTISTFESLTLSGTYWNGSSDPLGTTFSDGNAIFQNYYDTSYGGYWTGGWAYSNVKDSITAGIGNMYAARPASGYDGSTNYVVGQQNAMIKLSGTALGKVVSGFYITNGTYTALSMKDGDSFAKKFGGVSGNDSDWFKITIKKYYQGALANDSVEFYLADYRFADNTKDYIVNDWQWVDLTSLGNVDSLQFTLSSTDVGSYGMNTPAFFCMDNFTTADSPLAMANIDNKNLSVSVFPNPSSNFITVKMGDLQLQEAVINIIDVTGRVLYAERTHAASSQISVADLPKGIYYLKISGTTFAETKAFIKQ